MFWQLYFEFVFHSKERVTNPTQVTYSDKMFPVILDGPSTSGFILFRAQIRQVLLSVVNLLTFYFSAFC